MAEEQVRVSALIEDLSIYPRGGVSDMRVDDLAYAIDAGARLPPPVADRDSLRIIDGFHRVRAYRKRLGAEALITCEIREFGSEGDMLIEAARLNSEQGLPLGRYDQKVTALRARALGLDDARIASGLNITPQRLERVMINIAESDSGPVPLKRGTEHLSRAYLTPEKIIEIKKMRGTPFIVKARELSRAILTGIAPVGQDPELRRTLTELRDVITSALADGS